MGKTKVLAMAAVAVAMFGLGACDSDDPKGSPSECAADEYTWATVDSFDEAIACDFASSAVAEVLVLHATAAQCDAVGGKYSEHDIVLNERAPDVTVRTTSCLVSAARLDALTSAP